jgi:HEPN domain-containing protein
MNRSREMAQILLDKAKGDFRMLRTLLADDQVPTWGIGFHAQQAVEKAIKAVLGFVNVEYPYTHNIGFLLDLLGTSNHAPPPDAPRLPELTLFGALTRYGGPSEAEPSEAELDREWVLEAVKRTVDWASDALLGVSREQD